MASRRRPVASSSRAPATATARRLWLARPSAVLLRPADVLLRPRASVLLRPDAYGNSVWREETRKFETHDGEAFLQYRLVVQPRTSSGRGGAYPAAMDMVHTYVPGSKRGRGLAARLCDAAFAHARSHGLRVIPTCSYISDTYLPRNPALNELLYSGDEPKTSSSM